MIEFRSKQRLSSACEENMIFLKVKAVSKLRKERCERQQRDIFMKASGILKQISDTGKEQWSGQMAQSMKVSGSVIWLMVREG